MAQAGDGAWPLPVAVTPRWAPAFAGNPLVSQTRGFRLPPPGFTGVSPPPGMAQGRGSSPGSGTPLRGLPPPTRLRYPAVSPARTAATEGPAGPTGWLASPSHAPRRLDTQLLGQAMGLGPAVGQEVQEPPPPARWRPWRNRLCRVGLTLHHGLSPSDLVGNQEALVEATGAWTLGRLTIHLQRRKRQTTRLGRLPLARALLPRQPAGPRASCAQ